MTVKRHDKSFLFLQGPHGPFFYDLSKAIQQSGAKVTNIGFNEGDRFFWRNRSTFVAYTKPYDQWADFITDFLRDGVTDLVIYGDTRPLHKAAIEAAKVLNIRVHYFEEGYLRPYWCKYERDGVNGHSRLMNLSVEEMRAGLQFLDKEQPEAPALWGDMRQHILLGAVYHWQILVRNGRFKNYEMHRDSPVSHEFWLHFKRLITRPVYAFRRWQATQRIKRNGFVYHLSLLQLSHDASIRSHSRFTGMAEFIRECVVAFAEKAPRHHHLVFKSHPLEDDRQPLSHVAAQLAKEYGLEGRVHFVRGRQIGRAVGFRAIRCDYQFYGCTTGFVAGLAR